ncbi:MAG: F0F1 ATP synthase subunit A [Planctomycetes bacterium]|nr:F0F1 ATP synthase subunit A [Planctomycetota bacterium]
MNPVGLLASGAGHEPPVSVFTALYDAVKDQSWAKWLFMPDRYPDTAPFWFDAIGFSILAAVVLVLCSFLATRRYERVPRGIQNLMEYAVELLRSLVRGLVGPLGDRYLPFLGTIFLFIFVMNLLGLIPAFRSPTMTLSTTAALGITTFVMVQAYAIRATGVVQYAKHFAGDVWWLAILMVPLEIVGELARPVSLSLRLYGNIFGEDSVIEKLMELGGYIPVQLPILFLGLLTCFLQAFVFTCLASIYIGQKVAHHEEHEEKEAHAQPSH